MYILQNLDGEIRKYDNDYDFVDIVNLIQDENEDYFILETPQQCINYINDYCDNLTLTIS